jgi:hypothetical protein
MLAGIGLLGAVDATILMELVGVGPGIWAAPALGIAVGLTAGAGAFAGLHPHLEPHTPRVPRLSSALALVTAAGALMTVAWALVAAVGSVAEVSREELPATTVVLAFGIAIVGFVASGTLVALAAWRTLALPRAVASGLAPAIALTPLAPLAMVMSGAVPVVFSVVLLTAWGLVLIQLSRAIPRRIETTGLSARR